MSQRGVSIALAPGTGTLCARPGELLFVPAGKGLVDLFTSSGPGGMLAALTSHAETQRFEIDDFIAVAWNHEVRIVIFGDVEITSDHPSLPRLSAAGAGSWIERSLPADATATLVAASEEIDSTTSLEIGVVPAGGFQIELFGAEVTWQEPLSRPAQPRTGTGFTDAAAPPIDYRSNTPDADDAIPKTSPSGSEHRSVDASAAVADELVSAAGHFVASPDDLTLDRSPEALEAIAALTDEHRASPHQQFTLLFEPNQLEPVDQPLIIGRQPKVAEGEGVRGIQVSDRAVSGRHLRIEQSGGSLTVTDLGSTNGSFMLASGDGQPFPLEPNRAQSAESGAVIQIGKQRIWVQAEVENLGVDP